MAGALFVAPTLKICDFCEWPKLPIDKIVFACYNISQGKADRNKHNKEKNCERVDIYKDGASIE